MSTIEQPPAVPETDGAWLVPPEEEAPNKVHILDLVLLAVRERRLILWSGVAGAVLAFVAFYFFISVKYRSETVILPPEQASSRSTGNTMADLGAALASSEGVNLKSSEDFWTSVLKGRTINDYVIDHYDLKKEYGVKLRTQAEKKLKRRASFDIDKAGLITISVDDPDPKRAAQLANAYVEALHASMDKLAITDAAQRRVFFEGQLAQEKEKLNQAELALEQMQRRTGVITLGGQTAEAIKLISDLRTKIAEKTVEMQALGSSATAENPEMRRLQTEIDAERSQLAQVEKEQQGKAALGDVGPDSLPQATLDYIRVVRDLRYHEGLFEALAKQVEGARMDEARTAPMVQVVDVAIPDDKPTGLPRPLWVLIGFVAGAICGLIAAAIRQSFRKMKESPDGSRKLQEIREAL
jgi:uncharacterized protein involved in exopolysaccharide biosynthesis